MSALETSKRVEISKNDSSCQKANSQVPQRIAGLTVSLMLVQYKQHNFSYVFEIRRELIKDDCKKVGESKAEIGSQDS